MRRALYNNNLLRRYRLPVPVISVGNITMGGTGKTPVVMEIADFFIKKGKKTAVVSRGYKGKAGKGPVLVSDGREILTEVKISGDEAMMMAEKLPGLVVVVGSDRRAGGMLAVQNGVEIIVLDDGFQHMKLDRDMDILCFSAIDPFGNIKVFPGGDLREPLEAASKADAVIITMADVFADSSEILRLQKTLKKLAPDADMLISKTVVAGVTSLDGQFVGVNQLHQKKMVAFCGIGHPEAFVKTLSSSGGFVIEQVLFADHYCYTQDDVFELCKIAQKIQADALVTTEKDAIKLHDFNFTYPVWVVKTKLAIEPSLQNLLKAVSFDVRV